MADDIKLNIKTTLGVDTGPAEEAMANLGKKFKQGGGSGDPGSGGRSYKVSPTAAAEIAIERQDQSALRMFYAENLLQRGYSIRDHKEIARLHKEQAAHLASMRASYKEIAKSTDPMVRHGLPDVSKSIREQERLVKNLWQDRLAAEREAGTGAAEGGGLGGLTKGMGLGQLAKGGLAWRGAAALGSAAVANPVAALSIGIPAAIMAAVGLAKHVTDEAAEYGEGIGLAYRNAERRMGAREGSVRGRFQGPGGMTRDRFLAMGYSGEQLTKMLDAYGMPGSPDAVDASVYAQGRFARAYGFGEQPEYIAGLGRRATQLGVGEPGAGQEHYWQMMSAAVKKGTQHGVDATEKMRSLVGLTEKVAAHTGVVSQRQFAGIAGMMAALEGPEGGSRFFKGERGAQYAAQIMEGIANPKEIAQQRLVQTALMQEFGHVPTAKEAGITNPDEARQYGRMSHIQQLQYAQGTMYGDADLIGRVAKRLDSAAGKSPHGESMLFEAFTGIDAAKQPLAYRAMAEAARQHGMKQSEIEPLGMFGLYGSLRQKVGQKEMRDIFKGLTPKDDTTDVEKSRAKGLANKEAFSTQVGQVTINGRMMVADIQNAVLNYTGDKQQRPMLERLKDGALPLGTGIGKGIRKGFEALAEEAQAERKRHPSTPRKTWLDLSKLREIKVPKQIEPLDLKKMGRVEDPERGATPDKQTSTLRRLEDVRIPAQIEPLKLDVTGTITVTGDGVAGGPVTVPAPQLLESLQWFLAADVERQMRARGQRPNAIQRGAP